MNSQKEFNVDFGKHARTIDYKDEACELIFTFDSSEKGDGWICLEHHSRSQQRPAGYDVAFNRTKEFLEACHFKVEVYGE